MHELQTEFIAKSAERAADLDHRRKINFNMARYDAAVINGKRQFAELDSAREMAKNTRWKAVERLDKYLEQFEAEFTRRGGQVIWAETAQQALEEILAICTAKKARTVIKSKSMVTEEIHLNPFLEKHGIRSVESDLGEYIQQIDGEPPYHIVTPAMHKSKEDIARLFHEKLHTAPGLTPEQITRFARNTLRKDFVEAEIGITGANFLIGDIGAVCVSENEGNARLSFSFPKTHIVVAGIEKMLPTLSDLNLFWPLLATFGTGQELTVYNSVITGPRQSHEPDGPDEMYVVLLDNGRTHLLEDPRMRESLYCIRCGACLNACPVYKNIGGHAYGTTYSGPIGAVITPLLRGMEAFKHLSYASSLCGNCTEVCPVRINLHELLLVNRNQSVELKLGSRSEKMLWFAWKQASLNRKLMNLASGRTKNYLIRSLFGSSWGNRKLPRFAEKSFNELWRSKGQKA